jgi:lipopolysaccharide transport system ATP-binding protein
MSAFAIEARGLSKRYAVGSAAPHRSLIDALGYWVRQVHKRGEQRAREFWAIRDVSLAIAPGESVGLIGHNGAGKSTLLKILSRITPPTEGQVRYRGRIGSLLEIGTGFHPQLSGRDNVYLSGAVLGMRHSEIRRKFDEIVDFSGIGAFIDEPVKHYSSGMYLRLAFAVAAHLETDILLVDEVLAVGDLAFQQKCLGRMESIEREGRTIIFVSHNLTAVQSLCHRAILLDHGRITMDGPSDEVVRTYLAEQHGANSDTMSGFVWRAADKQFDGPVSPHRAEVRPEGAAAGESIDTATPFVVEWEYSATVPGSIDQTCITVRDEQGLLIFDQSSWEPKKPYSKGKHRTRCVVPGHLFNNGTYLITIQFKRDGNTVLELPNALKVKVGDSDDGRNGYYGPWPGVIRPRLDFTTERIGS